MKPSPKPNPEDASGQPAENSCPAQTELWKRYHGNGPGHQSENDLVHQYLHLVKTVIGRLAINLPSHVSMDDLYSAGLIGLMNAVRNFNPKIGSPFEPYARLRIRGSALDELRRMDWVPRSVHAKARRVQAAMETLEKQLGRLPTEPEVAGALEMSLAQYEKVLEEIRPVTFICLDSCATHHQSEDALELESIAGAAVDNTVDTVSKRELAEVIQQRINQLPDMHRKVLALYYYEDLRLREIAQLCGLCESRICQIHSQAILAVRSYIQQYENRRQAQTIKPRLAA